MPSCATADGTSCKIQCESTHALHTLDSKITATCKNGGWNFGKYGSGDNKATPKFGCCEKQITSYGKAFAKSKTNRKYGFKFVEADATQALMAHQIKMKNTANAGYSFMLAFEAVVPADIVFETFARFEVVSRYDDEKTNQTLVMLASKVGHDSAAEKERFDLTFMMRSSGATNVKDFVEATDYTVRQYADRATHWCPGNEAIDNMLQPVPTTFYSSIHSQTEEYPSLSPSRRALDAIFHQFDHCFVSENHNLNISNSMILTSRLLVSCNSMYSNSSLIAFSRSSITLNFFNFKLCSSTMSMPIVSNLFTTVRSSVISTENTLANKSAINILQKKLSIFGCIKTKQLTHT